MSDGICLKNVGEDLYLRGDGSLNARNCDEFKNKVYSLLGAGIRAIHLELSNCTYMDSTFLGLLVGVHKKLRTSGGKGLTIYSPSRSALEHLESMGIDQILAIENRPKNFPELNESCGSKATRSPQDILAAHKNLMELSTENKKRFHVLAQVLEQQIRQSSSR